MNKALIYTRVSTDEQAETGQSLEVQEKICRRYATKNALQVTNVFSDPGRSGSDPNRPGLAALLETCKKDPSIKTVITQDIDRLARDTFLYLSKLKEFKELGIEVKFLNQPGVEDNLEGKLTGTIQASVAEYLAKQTGRKAKAVMTEKFEFGWWPSYAPIGYRNVENPNPTCSVDSRIVAPDEEIAPLIRLAFEDYATGNYPLQDLRDKLTDLGLTGRKGGKLNTSAVHQILSNPFYWGWMVWDGNEKMGKHKPLISKETFDTCQYIRAKHRNFTTRERKHSFLLNGILTCNKCGWRYVAEWHSINSKNSPRIAYYHCGNKECAPKVFIQSKKLEANVAELFKDFEFSRKFTDLIGQKAREHYNQSDEETKKKRTTYLQQRAKLEQKRNVLENRLLDDTIDKETFKRMHTNLLNKIDQVDQHMLRLENHRNIDFDMVDEVLAITRDVYATYKKATPEVKKHLLNFFFEQIFMVDGKILGVKANPIFQSLKDMHEVIVRNGWLRNPGRFTKSDK